MILGHDSGFRLDPLRHLSELFFTWRQGTNFGVDWSIYKGFLVVQLPEALFTWLFHSARIGQMATFVFWFFLMGISLYIVLFRLFPEKRYWIFRLFSSIFYMYNFFLLQGWSIAERAKFSLFAALPLTILILYERFVMGASLVVSASAFGLLYGFLNGGGSVPLYGATVAVIVTAFLFFSFVVIRKNGWRGLLFTAHTGVAFALAFCMVNAYWILPQIRLFLDTYATAVSAHGGIEGLLAWEAEISKYSSIINLLRLQGLPDWYNNISHPYANPYLHYASLVIASFIPIGVIGLGLFYPRKKNVGRRRLFILLMFLLFAVGFVFTSGSHKPIGILYSYLMRHAPGFAVFRSSFYKFGPVLWLSVIVLCGYYLNEIIVGVWKKWSVRTAIGGICIAGILAYHHPYFTADIFRFKPEFTTKIVVPKYASEMAAYMDAVVPAGTRVLLLPELDSGYIGSPIDTYSWGYYSLDVLPRIMSASTFLTNDSDQGAIVSGMYEAVYEQDWKKFQHLAEITNVRFILWRGDTRLTERTMSEHPPLDLKAILDASSCLSLNKTIGLWSIYEFSSMAYPASFVVPDRLIASVGDTSDGALITGLSDKTPAVVRLAIDDLDKPMTDIVEGYKVQAECMFCKPYEYSSYVENVQAPAVKVRPRSVFYYWFVMRKEASLLKTVEHMPVRRIDANLSFAQRRLGEILQLIKETGQGRYLDETINKFVSFMEDAEAQQRTLSGKDADYYAIRIMAYRDAQIRDLRAFSNNDIRIENLVSSLKSKQELWRKHIWMAESGAYRYAVYVPENGLYTLMTERFNDISVSIDGVLWLRAKPVRLSKGYHRIELEAPANAKSVPVLFLQTGSEARSLVVPSIRYEERSSARYIVHVSGAKTPFFLVFNQRFDHGWSASIGDMSFGGRLLKVSEARHREMQGYANGWFIDTLGDYDIVVAFAPHKIFIIGMIISAVSFVSAVLFIVAKIINCRRV